MKQGSVGTVEQQRDRSSAGFTQCFIPGCNVTDLQEYEAFPANLCISNTIKLFYIQNHQRSDGALYCSLGEQTRKHNIIILQYIGTQRV